MSIGQMITHPLKAKNREGEWKPMRDIRLLRIIEFFNVRVSYLQNEKRNHYFFHIFKGNVLDARRFLFMKN